MFCRFLKKYLKKISVTDKFLMVIMLVLIIQSGCGLFFGNGFDGTIDVMVRTSAAAIFGYFLSGNFIKTCSENIENTPNTVKKSENYSAYCKKIQTAVVAGIGILSLILLIIFRNAGGITQESATISQLRDFVSSCVGFLVGNEKV